MNNLSGRLSFDCIRTSSLPVQIFGQTMGTCPKHHWTNFVFLIRKHEENGGGDKSLKVCQRCVEESMSSGIED